jgi:putative glutamine amidotransferase
MDRCHGLVLSGGIDTHPRFYKSETFDYPLAPKTFDEKRDLFELDVFRFACDRRVPLLAVCRGMQLVNIALGGDMIQDLETSGKNNHRKSGTTDGIHSVVVEKDSLLYSITQSETGTVNSAHHQGLGSIASDLLVNAWSADGIAEGVEWKDKSGKNFFLGVQWHPERLEGILPGNPLGVKVRELFLEDVQNTMLR